MIFGSFEVVLLAYKLAMIVFANSKKRPSVPGLYLIQLPDLCFASKTSIIEIFKSRKSLNQDEKLQKALSVSLRPDKNLKL